MKRSFATATSDARSTNAVAAHCAPRIQFKLIAHPNQVTQGEEADDLLRCWERLQQAIAVKHASPGGKTPRQAFSRRSQNRRAGNVSAGNTCQAQSMNSSWIVGQ